MKHVTIAVFFLLADIFIPHHADAGNTIISDSVRDECVRIGRKLGSVSIRECMARRLQDTGGKSVSGQAIMMKEYPPIPPLRPRARVLMIGGIHGDEYSAVSITFKWMRMLDRYHSGHFYWHVIPLLNPDGLLQRHATRMNAHHVDLNRNFPTPAWLQTTNKYWFDRTRKDPRHYPGPYPLSEPESRWLYQQIRDFKPQVIISIHAPYGLVDFDGPPSPPVVLGRLHLKLLGTYPGSLGNCAGVQHGIPVVTLELPYAGIMPRKREIATMWRDLIHWLDTHAPAKGVDVALSKFDEVRQHLITGTISEIY